MSNFVGSYVKDMAAVLAASALSRQHAIVLGAPGYGKTAVSRSIAWQLTDGKYSFVRIDPSTPPEVVRGAWNPAKLMEGELVRVVDGTPYDPDMKLAIIDEIGRGNDVTFDALLDTLDRQDTLDSPPVWATSNFMPTTERIQALIDRFGLWFWVQPGVINTADVVAAQLNGTGGPQMDMSGMPTWAEIQDVRSAKPGPNALAAISELLENLKQEASKEGRRPHPRRISQWTHLIFRTSVWHTGTADFTKVPDEATGLLKYAWPATSPDEAASWAKIAGNVIDTVGAAIEAAMAQVLGEMKKIAAMGASQRSAEIPKLGTLMQSTQATLESVAGPDDKRVQAEIAKMNTWLAAAIQGREIE